RIGFYVPLPIVNLGDIEASFDPGAVVDEAALRAKGLVKGHNFDGIKILGDGALTKALEVHATRFSGSAATKIAAVGGKTIAVPYTRRAAKTQA
ncbi:MAG: uL15 family ribosomal protein, partial [Isosphaeraceae bacterium]